jgi:hypothetical protein
MNFFSIGGRPKTRRRKQKVVKPVKNKTTQKRARVTGEPAPPRPIRKPQRNEVFKRKCDPVVSVTDENGVKVYHVRKIMTDKAIADKISEYFPSSHYSLVVKEDTDVWGVDEEGNREKLLVKFRKGVIPEKHCRAGIANLKKAAMKRHDNRGAAAGPIDLKKMPLYANDASKFVKKSKFRILAYVSKETGKLVNNSLGNQSTSNIIGYFDKPDRNIKVNPPPCRETAFTSQQVNKWKNSVPLIESIDREFKRLVPDRHSVQYKRAHETPFVISDTAFSTVTINHNWRTGLHTDKGDLTDGFGNLVVLEEGDYEGGYTGFPQYGICVDARHGDFLGMNVHEWHCNTEIRPKTKDYTRLSLVCYLREKMVRCKGLELPKNN